MSVVTAIVYFDCFSYFHSYETHFINVEKHPNMHKYKFVAIMQTRAEEAWPGVVLSCDKSSRAPCVSPNLSSFFDVLAIFLGLHTNKVNGNTAIAKWFFKQRVHFN